MSEKRKRDESPEKSSRPIKSIPASKLQAFSIGSQKKTAFQRHKEEEELKKQQESLEAAKVYAEFVASFEEPKPYTLGTTNFIKSGTLNPKNSFADEYKSASVPAKSSFKPMSFVKAGETPSSSTTATAITTTVDEDSDDDNALMKKAKAQKKRNLDSFLEEIKKEQEGRAKGETKSVTASNYSNDAMDENSNSTNLYVGNIMPTMTEMGLCQEFGKYGPIASVKIMWPRTQEEKEKGNNCGFVCFMNREDAGNAIRGLDGKMIEGFTLRVCWGKAVPVPDRPFFVLDKKAPTTLSGLPFNAQISPGSSSVNSRPRAEVHVIKPVNIKLMRVIHRVIERVLVHGPLFEAIIMDKEVDNPLFKFLYDNTSPEHIYYRWKLYSLSQGDTKFKWHDKPFQMFEGGPWWIPPELPLFQEDNPDTTFDSDDELIDQDNATKGTLGTIAKQRLAIIIRDVTFQRGTIARAMAFAIDHSDAAKEIVDILCKSIVVPDSPLSVKLARLYLISDILHNSSVHVSNAWQYRKEFTSELPAVFDHLNGIYRSINARLKAEQVRKHISAVISVWENWMIFPRYYTDQLTDIFLKKGKSVTEDRVDGEPVGDTDGEPIDDVDGEPIDDVDGEPMDDDIDGEPMDDDIDGEPMDDIDGEPMDDIDGEPMNIAQQIQNHKDVQSLYTEVKDMFA